MNLQSVWEADFDSGHQDLGGGLFGQFNAPQKKEFSPLFLETSLILFTLILQLQPTIEYLIAL